uniref:hypothetical protein n=1 Tax=Marinobacterium profundum TaxID=1714300 RepID=UPI0008333B51|nr:hypothetical protein [Marinobacterium profundum]
MYLRMIFLVFSLLCAKLAMADWNFSTTSHTVLESPTAFGVSVDGARSLALTCVDGNPLIFAHGYPAVPGANRQDSFAIVVDGQSFTVTGEHAPPDGLWSGAPTADLIAALKKGRIADVTPVRQPTMRVPLKGSSIAIDAALERCAPVSRSQAGNVGGNSVSKTVLTGALIAQACAGDYQIAEGAELTGQLDGDDKPDIMLDWAGVSCADASKGRGAGRCGINMCTIEVFFTQTQKGQQLLGHKPQILQRAFGKSALRTLALRPSCPGGALECWIDWRWNGTELEAVR